MDVDVCVCSRMDGWMHVYMCIQFGSGAGGVLKSQTNNTLGELCAPVMRVVFCQRKGSFTATLYVCLAGYKRMMAGEVSDVRLFPPASA